MAFYRARNFQVETVNATEIQNQNNYGETSGLQQLIKAACIAAGHRSAERSDAPKCHPETRQAIISNIMSWVNSKNPREPMMWLNGPAGAGKSAIAQTVAEACNAEGKLMSSFFFSRTFTSGGRDDGARLIPTIAYHLAIAIPEAKEAIIAIFKRNPAILSYSMEDQMKDLILGPLADVIARVNRTGNSASPIPYLVIIDGLDECNNRLVQSMILNVIARVQAIEPSIHLRFLIASRPEHEIRKTFESLGDSYGRLTLDESYDPDRDIELYLRSEFSRIKRTHTVSGDLSVDSGWPSQQDVDSLVEKSSGQFIYASTIVKFVDNDRKDPRDRLRTVLNVSARKRSDGSPFAPLDALYTFILSTAVAEAEGYDSIQRIFQALLYGSKTTVEGNRRIRIDSDEDIANFFGISRTVVRLSLVDLHSIMFIPGSFFPSKTIRFFHASFGDFLIDSSRSNVFFIEEVKAHIALGNRCLDIVLEQRAKANNYNMANVLYYAPRNYFMHMERSGFNEGILSKLRSHDIRSVIPEIFSGLSVIDIDDILHIFCKTDLNDYAKWGNWKDIVPLSKMHEDIINYISPGIDEFFLKEYPLHETFNNIIMLNIRRYKSSVCDTRYYQYWLTSLVDSPARGQHLFMSEGKCEHLACDIFQEWTTKKTPYSDCITRDMAVLKYLFNRVKPSSSFGMFLHNELKNLVAFLSEFRDPEDIRFSSSQCIAELVELVTLLIKDSDLHFKFSLIYKIKFGIKKLRYHG